MDQAVSEIGKKAHIDFGCVSPGCDAVVEISLADVGNEDFQAICPVCHQTYAFDEELRDKLRRMLELVIALRNAEDILGDTGVSVNVAGGSVKIPYALLLTRLNTLISLEVGDEKMDFHLRVEPTSPDTFR